MHLKENNDHKMRLQGWTHTLVNCTHINAVPYVIIHKASRDKKNMKRCGHKNNSHMSTHKKMMAMKSGCRLINMGKKKKRLNKFIGNRTKLKIVHTINKATGSTLDALWSTWRITLLYYILHISILLQNLHSGIPKFP